MACARHIETSVSQVLTFKALRWLFYLHSICIVLHFSLQSSFQPNHGWRGPTSATKPSVQLDLESGTICRWIWQPDLSYSRFRHSQRTFSFGPCEHSAGWTCLTALWICSCLSVANFWSTFIACFMSDVLCLVSLPTTTQARNKQDIFVQQKLRMVLLTYYSLLDPPWRSVTARRHSRLCQWSSWRVKKAASK